MFRLVCYENEEREKGDFRYIQQMASETVAGGLRYVYGDEEHPMTASFAEIMLGFSDYFFFDGLSEYVQGEDDDDLAGEKFIQIKVHRMLEKMADPDEAYTFDLFEELLFYEAIHYCREHLSAYKKKSGIYDKEREKAIADTLVNTYHYTRKEANKTSKAVANFHLMCLKRYEEENLFFWDEDFAIFFEKGFVEGIRCIESTAGQMLGYGYDHACQIFTDAGINAPLRLLGTKEASETAYEYEFERIRDAVNVQFPVPPGWEPPAWDEQAGEKDAGMDGEADDDDLPFN